MFSFGTNITIIMNENEILMIGSNENASCRHIREGCLRRLCHKSGSVEI